MKTRTFNTICKSLCAGIFTSILIFSASSCSRKVSFATSTVVPAARGYVLVKKDRNNNYMVHIQLSDLAEVSRLQPPKHTYIVWLVNDRDEMKNVGQINSSKSMFSNSLKAEFETVSAYKPSKIVITAEDDASVTYPGMMVVLVTNRF